MRKLTTVNNGDRRISKKGGRWEFLDAARGLAAVLVLIQHACDVNVHPASEWMRIHLSFGVIGVATFFLVSGFIIPVSLEKYNSLRKFWIGRIFRLFPLYLFSFALTLLFAHLGIGHSGEYVQRGVRFYLGNLTMCQELLKVPYALPVYWTLTYEGVFYVACSILFLLGALHRSRVWAVLLPLFYLLASLAAAFAHRALSAEKAGVVLTAFMGTLVYRYAAGKANRRDIAISISVLSVSLLAGFWLRLVRFHPPGEMVDSFQSLSSAWVVGAVLFGCFFMLREKEFPRPLIWLGNVSYSLYLMHPLVLDLIPRALNPIVFIVLTVVVTVPVAYATYRFIELPAQNLQRRILRRGQPTRADSALTHSVKHHAERDGAQGKPTVAPMNVSSD